jgi:hypothetical protein
MRGPASIDVEIERGETATSRFEVDCDFQLQECDGNLDLAVSESLTPEFTWNPVCRIDRLIVTDLDATVGDGILWIIHGPPFLSPLRYGTTPAGVTLDHAAVPIAQGHLILVRAEYLLSSGGRFGENASFTR